MFVNQDMFLTQHLEDVFNSPQPQFVPFLVHLTVFSAAVTQDTSLSRKKHAASAQLESIGLDPNVLPINYVIRIIFGTIKKAHAGLLWPNVESMRNGMAFSVFATTFMTGFMACAKCVLLACFLTVKALCLVKTYALSQTRYGTEINVYVSKDTTKSVGLVSHVQPGQRGVEQSVYLNQVSTVVSGKSS